MTITDELTLPTPEEINHKTIPLTHNYLLSSAMWLGKYCDNQCKEFMLCRSEERDPRKCLEYGRQVTDCGLKFFKKVKKSCREELEWYTKCLDFSGNQPMYRDCRNEQALFDSCMYEHGFERAPYGHFQMVRIHDSERPRPKHITPVFEDAVPSWTAPAETEKLPKTGVQGKMLWESWF